eukprot:TRINITY_DN25266_c0_g1_i1.p1 TRINITY_DN25266_c0_g1~~TRINITY_DN25266_c0_g1_i1.p1  ORF type:complete len:150 (-),score=27.03 TRINITY_DN25266_c0_g1_i1:33-416(-)
MAESGVVRISPGTRWSEGAIYNNTVYVIEVPTSTEGDIVLQTREVLENVDTSLARCGTDKSQLIQVIVFLKDLRYVTQFNEQWDAWLAKGCAPVRACVKADLVIPGHLVELVVTAAKPNKTPSSSKL